MMKYFSEKDYKISSFIYKMLLLFLVILISPFITVSATSFHGAFYTGDEVLRVRPSTNKKVLDLRNATRVPGLEMLDSWLPTFRPNHPSDFYVKKKEVPIFKNFLNKQNISFEILVRNVTKAILKQRTLKKKARYVNGLYDYERFHPLAEIHGEMRNLHGKNKDRTELINLGKSYQNRSMLAIKILGKKKKKQRKIFFIDCGTHAREWLSPATCMWFIKEILKQRKKMKLCNKIDWVVIPVVNVDGYVHTWTEKGRFWRKNRKPNDGSKCIGTDLNRNWAYKWEGNSGGRNPCASYYRGETPFSEIEVRNIAKFLYKNRCDLLGYIGFHSYSQFWMTPWGYKTDHPEHYDEMIRVAKVAVKAIGNAGYGAKFEEPGPSSEVIYQNHGSAKDWTYGVLGTLYSYGVELRPHFNGQFGFLVPPSEIKPSGEEILAALNAISKEVNLYHGRKILNKAHSDHNGHTPH